MRTSLRATKFALWVVFISSTVALVLFFGLNSIFASQMPAEPDDSAAPAAADAPWITVQPEGGRLVATAVNFNATDWQSAGPNSSDNCNSTIFETPGSAVAGGNEVTLEPADYGRYRCFQAADGAGEYIHRSYYVADSGSAIAVSQSLDEDGQTVLTASYHRTVLSWQSAGPLPAAVACAAPAFDESPASGATVTIEASAGGIPAGYYCFRAETGPDSWIYKPYRLQAPQS